VSRNSQHNSSHAARSIAAIILAAGKGKRMNSDLPKVVHTVAGQPMVRWVVQTCRQSQADPIVLVIGHGAEHVRALFSNRETDIRFVMQHEQLGTGHAVDQARPLFESGEISIDDTDVFVLAGDGPLIRAQTLQTLLQKHRQSSAAATLATSIIPHPAGYGRIVRDSSGRFSRIIEEKDATPAQLQIHEVNPSYYVFQARPLFAQLGRIDNKNASGEYYITDIFSHMLRDGYRVEVIDAVPPEDIFSINDAQQLREIDEMLTARLTASRNVSKAEVAT
jgi:bifunctional UDP-N-acetylglucosamine pyrophosphorylase/glucosamine-1-phosphate N-acetyltransferase